MSNRIGDVYQVDVDDQLVAFFHYVARDLSQLGSPVIRVYAPTYLKSETPTLDQILARPISFYAHTSIGLGVRLGCWLKFGHQKPTDPLDVLFRQSNEPGNLTVEVSYDWSVWRVNEPPRHIGTLTPPYQSSELGIVMSPASILRRIRHGTYGIVYPTF